MSKHKETIEKCKGCKKFGKREGCYTCSAPVTAVFLEKNEKKVSEFTLASDTPVDIEQNGVGVLNAPSASPIDDIPVEKKCQNPMCERRLDKDNKDNFCHNEHCEFKVASPISDRWEETFMDVENLSSRLHQVYEKEIERQGKKSKHPKMYHELSEDVKNLDRALARYILEWILPTALSSSRKEERDRIRKKIKKLQREDRNSQWKWILDEAFSSLTEENNV